MDLLGTFIVAIVVRGVGIAYADVDTSLLIAILSLGVLVGFSEEMLFRGIFLRCMRNGQMSEGAAALWTTAAFGLFHLPNVFLGTGLSGLSQVVVAGLSGVALYYFRVASGALVVAMVMHGLFDITTFLSPDYGAAWSQDAPRFSSPSGCSELPSRSSSSGRHAATGSPPPVSSRPPSRSPPAEPNNGVWWIFAACERRTLIGVSANIEVRSHRRETRAGSRASPAHYGGDARSDESSSM